MNNRKVKHQNGSIKVNNSTEGETMETMVERMVYGNEPIEGGSELIYTQAKDGVVPSYNHRADKFEIAIEQAENTNKSLSAKNYENNVKLKAEKGGLNDEEKDKKETGGAESVQGTK